MGAAAYVAGMNATRASLFVLGLALGSFTLAGCGDSSSGNPPSDGGVGGSGGGSGGSGGGFGGKLDKLDLLLMVDNSPAMGDKQQLLADAVPSLVQRLVTPRCLNDGDLPTGDSFPCPAGAHPEISPIQDIHIGVVTSSLGGHGGNACENGLEGQNDHAHLLPTVRSAALSSFQNLGFLSWDPEGKGGTAVPNELIGSLAAHVKAVGESGCGYEAPLESWYRFLIDPEPPESIKQSGGLSTSTGVDQTVLAQRAAFLRPDSAVAIVMLTDENDCSIRDDGQAWLVSTFGSDIPRATSQCAVDPDDSCCRSCGQADPAGCPSSKSDPECMKGNYDQATEDTPNLRCWEQKRRFGVDWLYPTQRYVDALTSSSVMSRSDMKVPNPLLASGRSSYQVFLIGIVGVPWQLVSTDESQTDPSVLEYESANQIDWAKITKSGNQPPTDPHMVESPTPRAGLPGPSSLPGADPINGHEWSSTSDLNYACIFPLPTPRDCSGATGVCECKPGQTESPLCQAPDGSYGTTQYFAKAYPSLRQLDVLRQLGDQAVVASVCPKNIDDASSPTFGYRPAVDALVRRLRDVF